MNEKNIIIELLQSSLAGKLDPSVNFRPQFLADAIIQKINFNQPIDNWVNLNSVEKIKIGIAALDASMLDELNKLTKEEKLFGNFLRGKLTAYAEVLDILKTL
jgi:hypothetical protein